ncbi:MAG: alanine racemase [Calditrichota bacterium]
MKISTTEKCSHTSLIINKAAVKNNIQRVLEKTKRNSIRLRPHCKTHQSPTIIGRWLENAGIDAITVSSLQMAEAFAIAGWKDILIAIPVNLRELDGLKQLASKIRLGVFVESALVAARLAEAEAQQLDIWLKIDSGYGRTGVSHADTEQIIRLAKSCVSFGLNLRGIATHAGHTYKAESEPAVEQAYRDSIQRMLRLQADLLEEGIEVEISAGDTPSASLLGGFGPIDELRPGNFVYYDLMQEDIGSCKREDIAVAVACPVLAVHSDRGEVVIHGGAVHLSKEVRKYNNGQANYGVAYPITEKGWDLTKTGADIIRLSQEHGIMARPDGWSVLPGDLVAVLPVHSCLAANLLKGEEIVI